MKTITIYDLLGLVKDNNAPKKILIRGTEYTFYLKNSIEDYYIDLFGSKWLNVQDIELNDEVEIIEEPKEIEKLDVALLGQCDNWLRCPTNKVTKQDIELNPYIIDNIRENTLYFQRKINELIDVVNELKKEEK